MQTSTTQPIIGPAVNGATLVALTNVSQLVPGTLLTGIAFTTLRRVVTCEHVGGQHRVVLQLIPEPTVTQPHAHRFSPYTDSGDSCSCGIIRKPVSDLLPQDGSTARTWILVPTGTVTVPIVGTLYMTAPLTPGSVVPQIIKMGADKTWRYEGTAGLNGDVRVGQTTGPLPLITIAYPVWRVPDELQFLMTDPTDDPTNG